MKNSLKRESVSSLLEIINSACKDSKDPIIVGGSYSRGCSICGDLDLITSKYNGKLIIDKLNADITASGDKLCRMEVPIGHDQFQIDIRFSDNLSPKELYFLTLHEQGNSYFNIVMRSIAKKMNYKLNEYGLYNLDGTEVEFNILDEASIFHKLGLKFIPLSERTHDNIVSVYRTINKYKA